MQLPFFKKKAKSTGRAGVTVFPDLLAVVHLEMRNSLPYLLQCETGPLALEKEAGEVLEGDVALTPVSQQLALTTIDATPRGAKRIKSENSPESVAGPSKSVKEAA